MTAPDPGPGWSLRDFLLRLDHWAEQEGASVDLRLVVTAWVQTRMDDPYQGARRVAEFPNLWFGRVPGTEEAGAVVTCSFWIFEADRSVLCDGFATLSLPLE